MRNLVLDGIRGWAALAVVLFHFIEEPLKGMTTLVTDSWFFFMFDGTFYVCIFFAVSGQALSASFMRTGSLSSVDALLVKRYARLTIPILISCLLVYTIIALELDYHKAATEALNNHGWMGRFMTNLNAEFPSVVKYALIDVYTKHTTAASPNPFLWTMSVEMVGSLLIFCICYVWSRLKRPFVTLLAVTALLLGLGTFYCLFLAGVAISAMQARGKSENIAVNHQGLLQLASFVAPMAALVSLHAMNKFTVPVAAYCALAILSVLALQHNLLYRRLMTHPLSLYLGRISFPLYVVHFAILISPTSFFWSRSDLFAFIGNDLHAHMLIGLIGALACIPVASLFLKIEKTITPRVEAALLSLTLKSTTQNHDS